MQLRLSKELYPRNVFQRHFLSEDEIAFGVNENGKSCKCILRRRTRGACKLHITSDKKSRRDRRRIFGGGFSFSKDHFGQCILQPHLLEKVRLGEILRRFFFTTSTRGAQENHKDALRISTKFLRDLRETKKINALTLLSDRWKSCKLYHQVLPANQLKKQRSVVSQE